MSASQVPGQSKEKELTLLDMNKGVLVTPEDVCLFAVQRVRQDSIDSLESSTFERWPLCNDVFRSINDTVIGGTCPAEIWSMPQSQSRITNQDQHK
jgi:hypothetical protein